LKPTPILRAIVLVVLALAALLSACNLPVGLPVRANDSPTQTPFQPGAEDGGDEGASETEETAAAPNAWWFDPALPEALVAQLTLPAGAELVEMQEDAAVTVEIARGEAIGHWVYALVAPFPTLTDAVAMEDLLGAWQGDDAGPFSGAPLMMSADTLAVFSAWWGEPASSAVQQVSARELLDAAWDAGAAWAIVPFEELAPRWKVLTVDGQSPLWKEFDPADYELSVPIGVSGEGAEAASLAVSNRAADKLTTVIVTGVTALVRATAYEMNRSGVTYPAEDVGAFMAAADITHISNEVPFWSDCPSPDPVQRNLIFCSDPSYIELLEAVGTDVVELTGDHFNDFGRDAMLYTLDLYDERGMPYYGGGHTSDEARAPLVIEHNGNRIAFIGCNGKGGGYATATESHPGAVGCDYEYLSEEIARLHAEGYLVITTFQHNEVYTFVPQPGLIRDFGGVAEAGSSVVSGSQAHQTHGVECRDDDSLIMYGLGNMFFDQRSVVEFGDQALIARHVFYDGRYLNTELFTIIFVDFAKPRFMTDEERVTFLNLVFDASIFDAPTTEGSDDGS
jgi:poly-gamma-glutamate synthesis protein (capsule biosynthesis protein)